MKKRRADEVSVALSVKQPYAELILRGIKKIEYRSVATRKQARVYVYASRTPAEDASSWRKVKAAPGDLPTGVLVGTVEIVGCEGEPGDYRWKLARPKRLRPPRTPKRRPQPMFFIPF